jgi:hypothetical protein
MASTGIYLWPVCFSLKGSMKIALTLLTSGDHFFSALPLAPLGEV